jgi:hypothetical protein
MSTKITVQTRAEKESLIEWIQTRQGIGIWQNMDLSSGGDTVYRPGDYEKPHHWAYKLSKTVKHIDEIEWTILDELSPKSMTVVTRRYVDLSLFVIALEHMHPDLNVEVEDIENTSSFVDTYGDGNLDLLNKYRTISIYFSRYTMNPAGYHIGYEQWTAKLNVILARDSENTPRRIHTLRRWLVDIDSLHDVSLESGPESEECACKTGDCGCYDDHCCTDDECICELYTSPADSGDDDWAWEEFDHKLNEILEYPIEWRYNGEKWQVVNNTGLILYETD